MTQLLRRQRAVVAEPVHVDSAAAMQRDRSHGQVAR